MGFHTFDASRADRLEDAATRYRYLSEEELLSLVGAGESETVLDLGSGTGFYTASLARSAGRVLAVDLQAGMHRRHRDGGVAGNVALLVGAAGALPLGAGAVDAAVTTMTYHEVGPSAVEELRRVLVPGGRLVVVDWSAAGAGEAGPPVTERFDAAAVADQLSAGGFRVDRAEDRRETLVVLAHAPGPAP
jgi:ubiquinone/menaquinone biosynthesis C-methylase UbiE